MQTEDEPEWVTAKREADRRFSLGVWGFYWRTIYFGLGASLSGFAIQHGLVTILALDLVALVALGLAWSRGKLTYGTAGIALSVGVFQCAMWARGDQEPFANGPLLAVSLVLFLISLALGNRRIPGTEAPSS